MSDKFLQELIAEAKDIIAKRKAMNEKYSKVMVAQREYTEQLTRNGIKWEKRRRMKSIHPAFNRGPELYYGIEKLSAQLINVQDDILLKLEVSEKFSGPFSIL